MSPKAVPSKVTMSVSKYEPVGGRPYASSRRWTIRKMGLLALFALIGVMVMYNALLWHFDAFHVGTVAPHAIGEGLTALVLVAHDREEYLAECLKSIKEARGGKDVKIIVSMDDPFYYDVLRSTVEASGFAKEKVIFLENEMFLGNWFFHTSDDRITHHYKKVFEAVFDQMKFEHAIVLETDLTVSPDFFEYMQKGKEILETHKDDPDLFCVSGWNDNGFDHLNLREDRLMRTDQFPGLGWMMSRHIWTEVLAREWPTRFGNYAYDIWLRYSASTHTRDCIIPEVSRTHHIAKYGSHVNGEGYRTYDSMKLATGNTRISNDEFELVSDMAAYEKRVKEEALSNTKRIRADDLYNYDTLPKKNILVVIADDYSSYFDWDFVSDFDIVVEYFGLFSISLRAAHKGLFAFKQKDQETYVTILMQEHAQYWGIEP